MHAITLHPEWLFAVLALGMDVMNTRWRPSVPLGTALALHCSAQWGAADRVAVRLNALEHLAKLCPELRFEIRG